MLYESEAGDSARNPSTKKLAQLLADLDGETNSFASLTAPTKSYVQVGGGPKHFTVERRDIARKGAFRHFKAALPDGKSAKRKLAIGGSQVTVRADEMLELSQVVAIFQAFRKGAVEVDGILWRDMTAMFEE